MGFRVFRRLDGRCLLSSGFCPYKLYSEMPARKGVSDKSWNQLVAHCAARRRVKSRERSTRTAQCRSSDRGRDCCLQIVKLGFTADSVADNCNSSLEVSPDRCNRRFIGTYLRLVDVFATELEFSIRAAQETRRHPVGSGLVSLSENWGKMRSICPKLAYCINFYWFKEKSVDTNKT